MHRHTQPLERSAETQILKKYVKGEANVHKLPYLSVLYFCLYLLVLLLILTAGCDHYIFCDYAVPLRV